MVVYLEGSLRWASRARLARPLGSMTTKGAVTFSEQEDNIRDGFPAGMYIATQGEQGLRALRLPSLASAEHKKRSDRIDR